MDPKKIWTPEEYDGPTQLVHLHNHTVFSKLDGVATPEQYAEECKKRGYPAMSATEHGNMASVPDMHVTFKKYGVKYIPGCEIYYNPQHEEFRDRWYGQWSNKARGLVDAPPSKSDQLSVSAKFCNASENWADHQRYLRLLRSRHLTVLCKNEKGFENLVKLTTDVHHYGHHAQRGRSRIWFEKLCKYREGLIILSGCFNGPISYALKQRAAVRIEDGKHASGKDKFRIVEGGPFLGRIDKSEHPDQYWGVDGNTNWDRAVNTARMFRDAFGDDYYIELQMPGIWDPRLEYDPHQLQLAWKDDPDCYDEQRDAYLLDLLPFRQSIELADELGIPYAITNDVHYLRREDHRLQRLMMAIDQNVEVDSPDLFASNSSEQFMKTRAELWCTFMNGPYHKGFTRGHFERMCDNTLEIADKCKPLKPDQTPKTPRWTAGDSDQMLRDEVYRKLKELGYWSDKTKFEIDGRRVTYREQADIELDRFISKGFSSYFLITADLVRHGREQGYPFAPRGSAGGSLVCMLLGIHTLNPMVWGLSFDRFMSPSRGGYLLNVKMPEPVN